MYLLTNTLLVFIFTCTVVESRFVSKLSDGTKLPYIETCNSTAKGKFATVKDEDGKDYTLLCVQEGEKFRWKKQEATAWPSTTAATKCNGLEDLCDLRINQATFPGRHNAGSGFDGLLYYWSFPVVLSCFYRNIGVRFSEQLAFGIRYFDIDTCYGTNEPLNCHCSAGGKNCAYAGSIEKGLLQIDGWMKSNPNEVVIIHFNGNSQYGYRNKIAKSLEAVLSKLWPTNNFGETSPRYSDWLVQSNYLAASTWDTNPVILSCSAITTNAESQCVNNYEFIDLSAVGSYSLCTWNMAKICSKWLGEAQEACHQKRKLNGKTVNFLLVDWSNYYSGEESVVNKAKFMNQKNIKEYLGRDIFFPELQGCSYHAGWLGNYCWKYCAKYGWCWVNRYCGNNADICKQKSYSCYSGCGRCLW